MRVSIGSADDIEFILQTLSTLSVTSPMLLCSLNVPLYMYLYSMYYFSIYDM